MLRVTSLLARCHKRATPAVGGDSHVPEGIRADFSPAPATPQPRALQLNYLMITGCREQCRSCRAWLTTSMCTGHRRRLSYRCLCVHPQQHTSPQPAVFGTIASVVGLSLPLHRESPLTGFPYMTGTGDSGLAHVHLSHQLKHWARRWGDPSCPPRVCCPFPELGLGGTPARPTCSPRSPVSTQPGGSGHGPEDPGQLGVGMKAPSPVTLCPHRLPC